MMQRYNSVLSIPVLLLLTSTAHSHHAFAPLYDGSHTVTVKGVVTEFRLVNPHSTLTLESTDSHGNSTIWTVDFDGRVNLIVGGWTDDTIVVGERVTVIGNPARSGTEKMFFVRLLRADGSELLRPVLERFNAIDEQRRQRREQQN